MPENPDPGEFKKEMFLVCCTVSDQTPLSRFMSIRAHPNEKSSVSSQYGESWNSWHVLEIFPAEDYVSPHGLSFSIAINSQQKLQKTGMTREHPSRLLLHAGHQHWFHQVVFWTSSGRYFIWPDHPSRYVTARFLFLISFFKSRHMPPPSVTRFFFLRWLKCAHACMWMIVWAGLLFLESKRAHQSTYPNKIPSIPTGSDSKASNEVLSA